MFSYIRSERRAEHLETLTKLKAKTHGIISFWGTRANKVVELIVEVTGAVLRIGQAF